MMPTTLDAPLRGCERIGAERGRDRIWIRGVRPEEEMA